MGSSEEAGHRRSASGGIVNSGFEGADENGSNRNANGWMAGDRRSSGRKPDVEMVMAKDEVEHKCGFGSCTPKSIQRFHNTKCMLLTLCLCGITQGIVINGMIPVSITSLEKRFHLSSTESGVFASMYDIAVLLVLVPLSYFGGKGHKGRYLGFGMIIMGLGSFICALPQFAIGPYDYGQSAPIDTCQNTNTNSNSTHGECPLISNESGHTVSSLRMYLWVLLLGQFFHGIGASPLYTLGITYIDENTSQRASPVYLGIYLGFSTVGPALGFILGGMLLRIYGDIGKIDLSSINITYDDPRWYGAWWIGFVLAAVLAVIFSLPMLSFARELPEAKDHRSKDVDQTNQRAPTDTAAISGQALTSNWREILVSFVALLKNPTFTCLMIMQCAEAFMLTGFVTFIPKFVENIFSISASAASMITGAIVVPFGFCGNILGGYLIRRFKLLCRGIILLALAFQSCSTAFVFSLLIGCPQTPFMGVSTPYVTGSEFKEARLIDPCNSNCLCDQYYQPVCNTYEGVNYFSACFAGCQSRLNTGGSTKHWGDCRCVNQRVNFTLSPSFNASSTPFDSVEQGLCPSSCKLLPVFFALFAINVLCTFSSAMPIQQAELRCVPFKLRTMAVGLRWIFARLIGAIPGVIAFGAAIDTTCIFWDGKCTEDGKGSCLRYDSRRMALSILGFALGIKAIVITSLILAWKLYRAPKNATNEGEPEAAINGAVKGNHTPNKISPMTTTQAVDKF